MLACTHVVILVICSGRYLPWWPCTLLCAKPSKKMNLPRCLIYILCFVDLIFIYGNCCGISWINHFKLCGSGVGRSHGSQPYATLTPPGLHTYQGLRAYWWRWKLNPGPLIHRYGCDCIWMCIIRHALELWKIAHIFAFTSFGFFQQPPLSTAIRHQNERDCSPRIRLHLLQCCNFTFEIWILSCAIYVPRVFWRTSFVMALHCLECTISPWTEVKPLAFVMLARPTKRGTFLWSARKMCLLFLPQCIVGDAMKKGNINMLIWNTSFSLCHLQHRVTLNTPLDSPYCCPLPPAHCSSKAVAEHTMHMST